MKSRKKLKGMTLMEIIISMAVFAMLGVILLGIGKTVDSTTKASSRFNKKMTVQAPYAAAKDVTDNNITIDVNGDGLVDDADKCYYQDESGNNIPVTPGKMNIEVYFGNKSNPTQVKVQKYQMEADGKTPKKDAEGNLIKDGVPVNEPAYADMEANRYSTKGLIENNKLIYDADSPNENLNFQFIDIQPST